MKAVVVAGLCLLSLGARAEDQMSCALKVVYEVSREQVLLASGELQESASVLRSQASGKKTLSVGWPLRQQWNFVSSHNRPLHLQEIESFLGQASVQAGRISSSFKAPTKGFLGVGGAGDWREALPAQFSLTGFPEIKADGFQQVFTTSLSAPHPNKQEIETPATLSAYKFGRNGEYQMLATAHFKCNKESVDRVPASIEIESLEEAPRSGDKLSAIP